MAVLFGPALATTSPISLIPPDNPLAAVLVKGSTAIDPDVVFGVVGVRRKD
jgi:hypothetical protein